MPDPPLILLVAIPDTARRRYGCFVAAKDDDMPRFLKAFNPTTDVPGAALLMTTVLVQLMLVVVMFSDDAVLGVVALVAGWITI